MSRLIISSPSSRWRSESPTLSMSRSWSWRRISAGRLSSSACMAAACCCICPISSSRLCGGVGPNRSPYLSINPRTFAALQLAPRLLEAAVQRAPLQREDLVQPLLDVLEHGAQVVAVQRLAALLAELLQQIAQPLHTLAQGIGPAALEQVAQ